jgi:hypothetical protein
MRRTELVEVPRCGVPRSVRNPTGQELVILQTPRAGSKERVAMNLPTVRSSFAADSVRAI